MRGTVADRFWAKVDTSGDCWLWTASLSTSGYGQFRVHHSQSMRAAHRVAWEELVGPIPEGMQLDHLCRVRNCVRPAHLRVVTLQQNIFAEGSLAPAKLQSEQTHCKHGHPLTEDNIYRCPKSPNKRRCKPCALRSAAEGKARRKAIRA